jgi:hypothetical protein
MLSYEGLCRHPAAFPSLTGMTRAEFDELLPRFRQVEADLRANSQTTRKDGRARERAAGAGRPYSNCAADRLLMALMWLRVYPTYEVLGFFFALHKRNAQLNVIAALEVLDALSDFPFDRPGPDRKKARSAAEVMAAFPAVRVIIDAKEQRINKPQGEERQKPYYSGKKKAHAIKTQVVVDTRGRIEAVSESVPGSTHDLTSVVPIIGHEGYTANSFGSGLSAKAWSVTPKARSASSWSMASRARNRRRSQLYLLLPRRGVDRTS